MKSISAAKLAKRVQRGEKFTMTKIHQCSQCKMVLHTENEYHPYAACLMMWFANDGEQVRMNLHAVVEHGRQIERRSTSGEMHG